MPAASSASAATLQTLVQRMKSELAAATDRKDKLYAELVAANEKEPNEPAMDVLKTRLKLNEDLVEMRLKLVSSVSSEATDSQLEEMRALLTRCESAAMDIAESKASAVPPAGKKKTLLRDKEGQFTQKAAVAEASASVPSTSVSKAKKKTPTPPPQRKEIDWDNYPLARPPKGENWHEFYEMEGFHDLAKAQARVKRGDPMFISKSLSFNTYFVVLAPEPPCDRCVKQNLPCLAPDPAHNTNTNQFRCITCREFNGVCNKTIPGSTKHEYADAVVAYHNTANSLEQRPGLWMGPDVPELDILPHGVWERQTELDKQRRTRNSLGNGL
ncbi:hypothetical protein MIND_01279300 [Mycena indigotica]|uniref:Uncharacterized protein n=1 Tax=Mycena indigotica TaxID=2126181 RepID=A0A8H6VV82_9AGAR|nr:uncharacterized protein MIND_01279300 [Mycena indigotica]KAF7291348.1 hypothetical protein MIND_01279300 [Mycena indigotica]